MKSLPGLFEDLRTVYTSIFYLLKTLISLISPKGFEIHGDAVGEKLECETLNSCLSTEGMNGVNDDGSGVGLTGREWKNLQR